MNYIISDRDEYGTSIDLEINELPTAFVCNNDHHAYSLIIKLNQKGIKVPEDVSVIAFDNTIYSKLSNPMITTSDNHVDNMVEVASKVILKKLSSNKVYGRVFVQGEIIERDSVRRIG